MAIQQFYHLIDGTAVTTDGTTQVAMATFNVNTAAPGGGAFNNCTIFAHGVSSGFDSGSGFGGGEHVAAVFRVVSGTLTQIGTTQHVIAMINDWSPSANTGFSVAGSTITYWVVGSATHTINWLGRIDFTLYQPT